MVRLPILFGFFLSFATGCIVFLLSLLAKVTYMTLLTRSLTTFFVFGFLGVILGTVLEVFVAPLATKNEKAKLKEEMKIEDETLESELGDLLSSNRGQGLQDKEVKTGGDFKPAVFPRMTVEGSKVVSRGDSAVVS